MQYPDNIRLDLLWKQAYSRGFSSTDKEYFEEAVREMAPPPISGQDIWAEDVLIPSDPAALSSVVTAYPNLVLTPDPSVGENRALVAASTYGDLTTRLSSWIPPRYGHGYNVKLYEDDGSFDADLNPAGGLGPRIYSSDAVTWLFFGFGVLLFMEDPVLAGKTLPLHIGGYRYTGAFGVPSPGAVVDKTATFTMPDGTPSVTWSIPHGLGKSVSFLIRGKVGGTGPTIILEPEDFDNFTDPNTLTLTFADPVSGTAYLN